MGAGKGGFTGPSKVTAKQIKIEEVRLILEF
jgi:hypothetical protein